MKQWIKNLLLYAALIFALKFNDLAMVLVATKAFFAFCMLSSAGYLYNDARDKDADAHLRKCKRPIASGRLPITAAYAEMVLILGLGFGIAWSISPMFCLVAALYLATTLSYTFYFKHHVILDVMFISAGFLWRAAAGAVAIGVVISPWLLTCTAFLTLFIASTSDGRFPRLDGRQRQRDPQEPDALHARGLLVEFQAITTSGTVISYALYTVLGSPSPWLLLTLPYVLYGIFLYIFLVNNLDEGEEPADTLPRDMPFFATAGAYGVTVVGILFVTRIGV